MDRQKWNLANFAFLHSHVAARTGSGQIGGLGPAPLDQPDVLEEEEDQEEVAEEGRPAAAAFAGEVHQPGSPRARTATATRPVANSRTRKVDDAMLEVMERLRDRPTDARLAAATDPRIIWGQWVGSEMKNLGRSQWLKFTADVQALMSARPPARPQVL